MKTILSGLDIHLQSGEVHLWTDDDELDCLKTQMSWETDQDLAQPEPELRVHFMYPLNKPQTFSALNENGWTEKTFVEFVRETYTRIYREEGEAGSEYANLYNRVATDGPYGIWGHDYCDLHLMKADRMDDGVWHIWVES
jgi:hypothetical protein